MRKFRSVFDIKRSETFFTSDQNTYLNEDFDLVVNYVQIKTPIYGDLQVYYRRPIAQLQSPDGFTLDGAFYFSTLHKFNTLDDSKSTPADYMVRDGRKWFFWKRVSGNTGGVLSVDSYHDYLLLLESLPNSGVPA